jgi:hypothetical protein
MDSMPNKGSAWAALARTAPRLRVLLTVASVVAAIFLGFAAFNPVQAQAVVHDYGYYLITFTLGWFVVHLVRIRRETPREPVTDAAPGQSGWRIWLQAPRRWAVLAIAGTSLLCVIAEAPREKIIYDEYVLQATAMHIHFTRNVSTVVQGYEVNGVFLPTRYYLDKRPYFFALLLSLVHDLTGYRIANVYWLNAALTVGTLAMLFVVARLLANFSGGILAVLLLGTLPLLAQNTSGSGMEVLNLAMILFSIWLGILAAERPSEARLGAFVLAVVLLAQTRYESALYVFAVMLVLVGIWWREKKVILPWSAVAAPLLLIPIPLLQLVLYAHPIMWDLPKNLDSRFGVTHLGNNLKHAVSFLANYSREKPNSPLLVGLGVAGVAGICWLVARRPARFFASPARWVTASFALVLLGNLGLLMFYFWGELDDPMVSRLALPLYALLACCAAAWLAFLDTKRPATRWGIAAALIAVPLTYGRLTPLNLYTSQNVLEAEIRWEKSWIAAREPGSRFIITNKSCLPWLLQHEASIFLPGAPARAAQFAFHLREGTFVEVLVTQRLRATTPRGDFAVDADDQLPAGFKLEPLAEKRFGATLDRISRLTAVTVPVPR